MIRQQFDVGGYWKVIVYYNVGSDFSFSIFNEIESLGFSVRNIAEIFRRFMDDEVKGVTCSNGILHTSVVLFVKHKDRYDYLNSLVHEAEHIKQAMLKAYEIEDAGEPPAYTIGYLVEKMWEVFSQIW